MFFGQSAAYLAVTACFLHTALANDAPGVDFTRDIQPLFQAHCVECHGANKQKNGFRLDRRHDAMMGGTAAMIGRGNAGASRLYLRLIGETSGMQMPPDGPLTPDQISTIKAWIDQGAVWPDAFSGETPLPPADPGATQLMEALRGGDSSAFLKLLHERPDAAKRKGPGGSTPLMYAVLYGGAETVRLLLEAGADPNIRNDAGATALMWAADDADKTRLLLRYEADPNARSNDGRTPLLVATTWSGRYDVVKLLLDRGADPSASVNTYRGPVTGLRSAAEKCDKAMVQLLLERGANAKAFGGVPSLVAALVAGEMQIAEMLNKSADRNAVKTSAMLLAPPFAAPQSLRDPRAIQFMLDAGADPTARGVGGYTLLMQSVNSDEVAEQTIRTLIQRGGDINAIAPGGWTALDFAQRLGKTPVVDLLVNAGAKPGPAVVAPGSKPAPAASPRIAIERSLPLLQRADATFLQKSGCVSCHNNSMTAMTVSSARKAGFSIDEQLARSSRKTTGEEIESWRERVLQGMGIPGDSNTIDWLLLGLAAEAYPADPATDVMARYLKNDQMPDGHWRLIANRPPLNSSEIEATALSMRAIQLYAPQSQRAEYEKATWRAADWIRNAKPRTNADRAFQLLGLAWAHDKRETLQRFAQELLGQQRPDGGWAQLSSMESDAYATGQALMALSESGTLDATSPPYKRGVAYLLSTQLADGSWHVRSRSIAIQPHFESGFPHGHDQWISAAATNWATMALIQAAK